MLKKIDQADIEKLDDAQRQNLMVNADGEYVFAQADEKAWKRHLEQVKAAEAAQRNVKDGSRELQERGLECPIDKRMFVDPMKTPCCGKTYCHDCIENALIENDLTCPGCETENVSLERLEPDEDMKSKIKEYETEKQTEKSPVASAESPKAEQSENGSRPVTRDGTKSPVSLDSSGPSKKRRVSDVSTGNVTAPAMKRQKSNESAKSNVETASTPADTTNNIMPNMMPPDMSSMMQNMPMNFPMMPFMPMPMPISNMMGMNGMGMMPNFMNMNMMNGMMPQGQPNNFGNMNGNFNNQYGGQNYNQGFNQNYGQNNRYQNRGQQPGQQPAGLSGVPTGPKALQTQNGAPTGPTGNRFSNQQRPVGKEEDNAYMRQPVNPHRAYNRGRGKMRQADYREL